MSLMKSVKDITHYFRRESNSGNKSLEVNHEELKTTGGVLAQDEESNSDDCGFYLSDDDGDDKNERMRDGAKRNSCLVVQVPGIDSSMNSPLRKRKCIEVSHSDKKQRKVTDEQGLRTPSTSKGFKFCHESENLEDSFYMSPLRIDSDSSSDDAPLQKIISDRNYPITRIFDEKSALRAAGNTLFSSARSSEKLSRKISSQRKEFLTATTVKHDVDSTNGSEGGREEKQSSNSPDPSVVVDDINVNVAVAENSESPCAIQNGDTAFSHLMSRRVGGLESQNFEGPAKKKSLVKQTGRGNDAGPSHLKRNKSDTSMNDANCHIQKTNGSLLHYFSKSPSPKKSPRLMAKVLRSQLAKKSRKAETSVNSGNREHKISIANDTSSTCISLDRDSFLKSESELTPLKSSKTQRRTAKKAPNQKLMTPENAVRTAASESTRAKPQRIITENVSVDNLDQDEALHIRSKIRSSKRLSGSLSCKSMIENEHDPSRLAAINDGTTQSETRSTRVSLRLRNIQKSPLASDSVTAESPESPKVPDSNRKVFQKSTNQRAAAEIIRRLHKKKNVPTSNITIGDPRVPCTSKSDEIIIVSEELKGGKKKDIIIRPSYVKLAPLFLARDDILKKRIFLQSGAPDIVLRRMNQQKKWETEMDEASEFPKVSHTRQNDGLFPWNIDKNPVLSHHSRIATEFLLPNGTKEHKPSIKLRLGSISGLPAILSSLLINMRPPVLGEDSLGRNVTPSKVEDSSCVCLGLSSESHSDIISHEFSASDVGMFERVHSWLLRSILPPTTAFKMSVDLSSFLPLSSKNFASCHISALPSDSSAPVLKKKMLLRLKEEYPNIPINKRYKSFYERRKYAGGLYSLSTLPAHEVINLDASPVGKPEKRIIERENAAKKNCSIGGKMKENTSPKVRRSSRRISFEHSTPKSSVNKVCVTPPISVADSSVLVSDNTPKAPSWAMLSSESWTNIFAPSSYADACALGRNLRTLEKLENWLENWKKKSKKCKMATSQSDSDEEYSSGIEFYSSDDEDVRRVNQRPNNVAILIGPCGSGKTSSVYALAKEKGYKVLEINASTKRNGKYILASIKEATRSHQVTSSGGDKSSPSIGSFFQKSTPNSQRKSKAPNKSPKKSEESKTSSAVSLIFVEDVDVVFENEDEGFIGALTSLTTSTKRPVILEVHTSEPLKMGTTSTSLLEETLTKTCPHLTNFLAKQNRSPLILPFERSCNSRNAEALLRIACLVEGVWVSKQWSQSIFSRTTGDFRWAIQEAQFWAGSVARSIIAHADSSRYPKEMTQKDEIGNHCGSPLRIGKGTPANSCGCVARRACFYPYSWMDKDYIKYIWLNLDNIVNSLVVSSQDKNGSRIKGDVTMPSLVVMPLECLESELVKGIGSEVNKYNASLNRASPISEMVKNPPCLTPILQQIKMCNLQRLTQSCPNNGTRNKMKSEVSTVFGGAKRKIAFTSEKVEARRSIKVENLPENDKSAWTKLNGANSDENLDMAKLNRANADRKSAMPKLKVENGDEMLSKPKLKAENADDKIAVPKLKVENSLESPPSNGKKRGIQVSIDVLDLLCISDVLLKGFDKAGDCQQGKMMVFEMGTLSNLIDLSMQEPLSEKSREMKARQAKDSGIAKQHQMILPILPNCWTLNDRPLVLDVAPHIREVCRILDRLANSGKTRTRPSNRVPLISRVGPTLRNAMCRTLMDKIHSEAPS